MEEPVKGKLRQRYLDNTCSKHITRDKHNLLLLNDFQGNNLVFENGKQGEIKGIRRVGILTVSILDNVYYVEEHKQNVLSVSQMCDKGNDVLFIASECKVTNLASKIPILRGRRHKNVYKVDIRLPKKPK